MTRTPAIEALVKLLPEMEGIYNSNPPPPGEDYNRAPQWMLRTIIAAVKELAARDETHVWVPKEPTEEMLKAGVWALDRAKAKIGAHQDDRAFTPTEKHAVRYRAMIGAAP